jgi:hypothetical protein
MIATTRDICDLTLSFTQFLPGIWGVGSNPEREGIRKTPHIYTMLVRLWEIMGHAHA